MNEWIDRISGKVDQSFHIEYISKELFPVTFSFSAFSNLVHLVLDTNCEIKVPNTLLFQHLQTIKLNRVVFVKEFPELEDVYFNFPIVKSIEAKNCEWFENACIRASLLEFVSITMNPDHHQYVARRWTVKILSNQIYKFCFVGDVMNQNIVIVDPSSIRKCIAKIFLNYDQSCSESRMLELGFQACLFMRQFVKLMSWNWALALSRYISMLFTFFMALILGI